MFYRNATAVILASLATTSALHAGTIKVPEHYPTIDGAIEAAVNGDKIVISKGTYHENISAGLIEGLTIKAKGKVIVDAGGGAFALSLTFVGDVKIEGVTFRNASGSLVDLFSPHGLRFKNCRFMDTDGNGLDIEQGGEVEVEDCLFKNVVGDGIVMSSDTSYVGNSKFIDCGQLAGSAAIRAVGSYLTVQSNEILDDGWGQGIAVGDSGDTTDFALIYDNKVKNTAGAGIAASFASGCLIKDNVVLDGHDEAVSVSGSCDNTTIDGNRVYRAGYIGIEIGADDCFMVRNKIKSSEGDGLRIYAISDDNLIFKNKVTKSKDHGIRVVGSGNTFVKNVVKGSDTVDLMDEAGPGANDYVSNDFGTSSN